MAFWTLPRKKHYTAATPQCVFDQNLWKWQERSFLTELPTSSQDPYFADLSAVNLVCPFGVGRREAAD